ncbi:MAG: hypothetical protein GX556_03040 [Fibrobacter sp.]|nr:hypothetical protein [Fibrobacter sp.]
MKALIPSLVTVILVACSVYSEQSDKSLADIKYPTKVYVDSVRNRVYWPLDKEVYVRLAESADKSSASYLLSTEEDSGSTVKGLKLDMSGRQALRWLNAVTRDTAYLRFTADGEVPECKIKMSGAPSYINTQAVKMLSDSVNTQTDKTLAPDIKFYGKNLEFEIECNDKHSGVEAVYLSINNSGYKRLNGKMALTEEKLYEISYFGADKVGNISNPQQDRFAVDLTAPVSVVAIEKAEKDLILTRSEMISINSSDNLSGVKEILFRFDNDINFSVYKKGIPLRKLNDGKHTLFFYSTDNVDNAEEIKSLSFSIDDNPPEPEMVYSGDFFALTDKAKFISPRTLVKVEAKDNMSEVTQIEYSIDGTNFKDYTQPFALHTMEGKRSVSVRAKDIKGNISQIIRTYVIMDVRPPKCKYEIIGPQFQKNSTVCITPETKIVLSALDDASGVNSIMYQIGSESPVKYTGPITIDREGLLIIKYWGTDNVNNVSNAQSIAVVSDKTPPEIVETFSMVGQNQASQMKFPVPTALFLAARDNSAGVNGIWCSINGAREVKCDGTLQFDKAGSYSLEISSKDNVGNTSKKLISFTVE